MDPHDLYRESREAAKPWQRSGVAPEYRAARTAELNRRASVARQRTLAALRRAYPDEYRTIYEIAMADIHRERGPLPGETTTPEV